MNYQAPLTYIRRKKADGSRRCNLTAGQRLPVERVPEDDKKTAQTGTTFGYNLEGKKSITN